MVGTHKEIHFFYAHFFVSREFHWPMKKTYLDVRDQYELIMHIYVTI